MTKIFYSIFILILIFSCKNDDDSNSFKNISTNIDIYVIDSLNNDLLSPNGYNISENLEIYYKDNGSWVLYNESNLTYSKGYQIFKKNENYVLRVYPHHSKENKTLTIIKWKNYASDTIVNYYNMNSNSIINNEIYLNRKKVYPTVNNDIITIIK